MVRFAQRDKTELQREGWFYFFRSWGMKKKIAVLANGWSNESLSNAIAGIKKYAAQEDFDIFVFLSFASISVYKDLMQGELNIYNLCTMEDYDGIISLSNMMNSDETAKALCEKAIDKGIPVVSVGMEIPGAAFVGVNGNTGMRDLVEHLAKEHGVRNVVFVGGTPGHAESDARLQITKSVLAEYGAEIAEDSICYGGWSNRRTVDSVHAILEKKGMPDAFICANDVMALATATELMNMGYQVPKDVIVTGFDNIREGQIFYPAITSVKQNYDEVGFQCCRMLFEAIRDEKREEKLLVPTTMILGESCGCEEKNNFWTLRKDYCQHYYQQTTDASLMEQTERGMRQRISEVSSYAELKSSLRSHFERNHQFEGENIHLVLNSEYFRNPMASEREVINKRTRNKLEVVVSLKDGEIQNFEKVDRHQLIPGYEKKENEQHVYYFLPLHFFQYNYGYLVLSDEPYVMKENMLYSYMERLQQALKLLRTNLRLDALNQNLTKLYDKDPMTDLFNRFGYENKAIPLYQESVQKRESMMVMFVDINFMKRINDEYGHIYGDAAIKTVAEAIKKNMRDNWIAIRFGGDEFLIIAPNCDDDLACKVKHSILAYMEKKNHDGSSPFQISASCGYVITDPESGYPLQEYIREADRLMYEIKREVHARDEVERAREAQERAKEAREREKEARERERRKTS